MLTALPILIPLLTASLCLLFLRTPRAQQTVALIGGAALALAGVALFVHVRAHGAQVLGLGGWPAPFGIVLVADLLSALLVAATGLVGLLATILSTVTISSTQIRRGHYMLLHALLMGVCGAFLTGDLFNLYVWFEVMLMASFGLIITGGHRAQLEGTVKYATLNLVGSMFFLSAIGIIYGITGTLNLAALARELPAADATGLRHAAGVLLLIAFGMKAGAFPLFSWLPAAYHTAPYPVVALFSALLTKIGVYTLLRVGTLLFPAEQHLLQGLLLPVAALTMITGVLGAVAQYDLRRLLAFHIVSQIGYLLFGLALATPLAIAGTVFFLVHVMAAKAALFAVGAIMHHLRGTTDLKMLGGLYTERPWVAFLFLIPALSLAGIPPLSGFVGKFALVRAGLEAEAYWTVLAALGVSVLTLYSMIKIWNEAFWKTAPRQAAPTAPLHSGALPLGYLAPTLAFGAASLWLGPLGGNMFGVALEIADTVLNPAAYVQAVLGDMP